MYKGRNSQMKPLKTRAPEGMRQFATPPSKRPDDHHGFPSLKKPTRLPQALPPSKSRPARSSGYGRTRNSHRNGPGPHPSGSRHGFPQFSLHENDRAHVQHAGPRRETLGNPSNQYGPQAIRRAVSNDRLVYFGFLLPLIVFGILFLFWPKEQTSSAENRALAQRPSLSLDTLMKGDFSAAVDRYYADQFPGRDLLIEVNRKLESVYRWFPEGKGKEEIHLITAKKDGGGQGGVEMPPSSASNPSEQVQDDAQQAQDVVPVKEVKATEVEISEKRASDFQTSNIVIINGQAMEIHYYSPEFTEDYAKRINHLRSIMPENKRLISMVVPTAVAYYGTDELRTGTYSNFNAINNIYQHEVDSIHQVDVYSELAAHTDEYIYFRTDHHWTGRGAYYAYVAFCKAMDLEASLLKDMTLSLPEETFYGSLYGYTGESPLLLDSADQAEIFLPLNQAYYEYYPEVDFEDPISGTLLYSGASQGNQYLNYLGGDVPLGYIKSEIANGRSILVIKDSYANAFIPYLIDNYEHIYFVDPRQYRNHILDLIVQRDIQDVIVLNYTFAVSNGDWLSGFDYITGYTAS